VKIGITRPTVWRFTCFKRDWEEKYLTCPAFMSIPVIVFCYYYLFLLTANGFLSDGSGTYFLNF
jgi:hypothetical protein